MHKKSLLEFGAWRRDRRGWRAWDVGEIKGGERDGSIVVTKLVIMMSDAHEDDRERRWSWEAVDDVVVAEAETQKLKLCAADTRHDSIVLNWIDGTSRHPTRLLQVQILSVWNNVGVSSIVRSTLILHIKGCCHSHQSLIHCDYPLNQANRDSI